MFVGFNQSGSGTPLNVLDELVDVVESIGATGPLEAKGFIGWKESGGATGVKPLGCVTTSVGLIGAIGVF